MKGKRIKMLSAIVYMCLIFSILGMQGLGTKKAYAATDVKITGVTATASSASCNPAEYAIDAPSEESWWSAYNPGVCWLQLTLDRTYYIDRWYVVNMGIYGTSDPIYDTANTRDYKLQGSLDGINWTDIDTVAGNTADITNRTVTPFSAKYVRIYITDPDQNASMDQAFGSIVDFEVFAVAPDVTSVELPANNNYSAGNALTFKVKYPTAVIVNTTGGLPYIPVTIGTKTVYATYKSGTNTQVLTFECFVQNNDYDNDGITLGTSINNNGGTIKDTLSNNANLTLNGVGGTAGIIVDARARYNISVGTLMNGSITASVPAPFSTSAVTAGETVNLDITPAPGKQIKPGSLIYNDGTADHIITGTSFVMPAANVTITALFESASHTVTIGSLTGGTITADKAVATENETVNLTITPDNGMQLKLGSLKYNDGSKDTVINGTSFAMPASNATVSAEFETKKCIVQFQPNWTVVVPDAEVSSGQKITAPIVNTPGMRQDGWYKDNSFTTIWNFDTDLVQQDMTLYLKHTPNDNVAFASNGGGTINSQTVGSGEKIQEPTGVQKSGFTLEGWYLNPDFSGVKYDFNSTVTLTEANQLRTLYAKWTPLPTFDITVNTLNGGSITANPATAVSGSSITLTIIQYPGKQLKTGSLKYNDGTQDVVITGTSFVMPAANIVISAVFEDVPPIAFPVMVGPCNGGVILTNVPLATANSNINLTIIPEPGKRLKSGSLKYNNGIQDVLITGTSFVMPAAPIIITAEFENIPIIPDPTYVVTVASVTGGSITANPTTAVSGSSITLTITPDSGKSLKPGSLKYNDGTQEVFINGTSFVMPAAPITITAEFENATPIPPTVYPVIPGPLNGGMIIANVPIAPANSIINLIITPDPGKRLKVGSLKYSDGTQNVLITGTSFIMPAAPVMITAEFENATPIPPTVYPVIPGPINGGMIIANVPVAPANSIVNLIITPDSGKRLKVGSLRYSDGTQNVLITGTSFVMPAAPVMITAEFENIPVNPSTDNNTGGTGSGTGNGTGTGTGNGTGNETGTGTGTGNGTSNGTGTGTNTDTSAKLPSIEGSEVTGWNSVIQYIAGNNTGSITVTMNGETTVTPEVLEAVKGKEIDLTLDLGNKIEWKIRGTDLPKDMDLSKLQGIDLDLSMNSNSIPVELLNTLPGTDKMQMSLEYDGSFGFTATLRLPLEDKYSGSIANLFYYNPVAHKLELQAVGVVDKSGNVEFPFTHASDYVIVMSSTAMLEDAIDTITITPVKKILYIGGTKGKNTTVKTSLPEVIQKAVSDGVCDKKITYKSSNSKVATVSRSGKITAKKAGTVTITSTITVNGVKKKFQTTIKVKKAVTKSQNKSSINK